ncbi:EVE domain-containing protein [Sorangium sp. So ce834]|uniref:EVE domain-containing protein n=1 Tax=Sorangium sp. So ce834 TaxID=3133321 RepID=UPI003F638AF6
MATWIFQGNPRTFDVDGYLRAAPVIVWLVRQRHFAARIATGDRVFIWRSQGEGKDPAGIVAAGYVLEPPRVQPSDAAGAPFWRTPRTRDEELRTPIRIERHATNPKEIVRREWLVSDPVLAGLRILKMASETNYQVSPEHARRIEALWRNTGRDWNEAESVAGLWAYAQTYGGEVSRLPGTPVAEVALRIGRAVTGVYNKVMNFRHIDPRDVRTGFSGAGETDRNVWAAFFDAASKTLDVPRLNAEYARLWRPNGGSAPLEDDAPPVDLGDGEETEKGARSSASVHRARGQGREVDPAVRRAVEARAMTLAEEYYRERGFNVENTATTEPFDFRCTCGELEVRVEVKGTQSAGETIELTSGEVENARGTGWRTDLFVVRWIEVTRVDGMPVASGGTLRVVQGWKPADEHLTPIRFQYAVPPLGPAT